MALSNAERQRLYRQRHLGKMSEGGDKQFLRLVLDVSTRNKLKRIAKHRGVSVPALITTWADRAEQRILDKATASEQRKYYATTDLK